MLSRAHARNIAKPTVSWLAASWISIRPLLESRIFAGERTVRDQLEGLVSLMVERGILFDEAVGEFEKRFIKGNQSRAAEVLGIHRNTLSRKITQYKLDHRRGRAR